MTEAAFFEPYGFEEGTKSETEPLSIQLANSPFGIRVFLFAFRTCVHKPQFQGFDSKRYLRKPVGLGNCPVRYPCA